MPETSSNRFSKKKIYTELYEAMENKSVRTNKKVLIQKIEKILNYTKDHGKLYQANEQGETPLHIAIKHNCLAASQILVGYGVNPSLKVTDLPTPLEFSNQQLQEAYNKGNQKISHTAKSINSFLNEHPYGVKEANKWINKNIYERRGPKKLDHNYLKGKDDLHSLARLAKVKELSNITMDDIKKTSTVKGDTLLHALMRAPHHNVPKKNVRTVFNILVNKDPDIINRVNNGGQTPIHIVIEEKEQLSIGAMKTRISDLLNKGASLLIKDNNKENPLELAKRCWPQERDLIYFLSKETSKQIESEKSILQKQMAFQNYFSNDSNTINQDANTINQGTDSSSKTPSEKFSELYNSVAQDARKNKRSASESWVDKTNKKTKISKNL